MLVKGMGRGGLLFPTTRSAKSPVVSKGGVHVRRGKRRPLVRRGTIVTIVALMLAPAGVALGLISLGESASTAAARTVKPSAQWLASAHSALVQYLGRVGAPALHAPGPGSGGGPLASSISTFVGSYNWSGYVDWSITTGYFDKVSGTWTVPSVSSSCTSEDTMSVDWVGLDGWRDTTVEQDGVAEWCYEDVPTYFTWYEMYPAGSVTVGTSLHPGDAITASVSRSGTTYTLALTDSTHTANSFTETKTCAASTCKDTSAEWIEERPALRTTGLLPLADFGRWTLSAGSMKHGTTTGPISSVDPGEIDMTDSFDNYRLATTSPLTGGNRFSTTWDDSF